MLKRDRTRIKFSQDTALNVSLDRDLKSTSSKFCVLALVYFKEERSKDHKDCGVQYKTS